MEGPDRAACRHPLARAHADRRLEEAELAGAILLTGASGLIGRVLHRRLLARGEHVVALDRVGGDGVVECELTDVHRLHALGGEATAAIHCGAISGPMVARDNPHGIVQSNVVGAANVLELARIRRMRRVVFLSSTSAYGPTPAGLEPVPEDVPLSPSSVYGASKVAGEALVRGYAEQHGLDGVSLRPSWVYGPGRTTACAIRTMIEDALAGRETRLPFGRDFPRQYVHVEDVADAILLALDAPRLPRRSYTITGGSHMTLQDVADLVRRALPQARIVLGAGADPVDDLQARFDISAAERDLDYRPRISLEDGIRSYAGHLGGSLSPAASAAPALT